MGAQDPAANFGNRLEAGPEQRVVLACVAGGIE